MRLQYEYDTGMTQLQGPTILWSQVRCDYDTRLWQNWHADVLITHWECCSMLQRTRNEIIALFSSRVVVVSYLWPQRVDVNSYTCIKLCFVLFVQDNQKDLENATEQLSEYLERDITSDMLFDIKQKVQDKSRYCIQTNSCILVNCLALGWWVSK